MTAIAAAARRLPTPMRRQRGFITPALLGVVANRRRQAGPSGGLLGSYTANVWGGYALYQLWSSWTGNLIRVRRSSDSAEQDIGQASGLLDTAALATFVGSDDAFVVKWYDQTGLGNDFAQSTTTKQPMIVDAGTYVGEVSLDGTDDFISTANNSGTPTAFSVYVAGRDRLGCLGTAATMVKQSAVGTGMGDGRNTTLVGDNDAVVAVDSTNSFARSTGGQPVLDGTVYAAVLDRTKATVALENVFYKNGTVVAQTSTTGSDRSGSYTAGTWCVGQDSVSSAANLARVALKALLIYEDAHTSGTVIAVSALLAPGVQTDGIGGFTTNLWAVWSLRRQVSGYAGSAIRVRRSSDNTEQDIGFDATTHLLDTAALATFVGAGNGFVTKIYDQSGAGRDLVQATTTKQAMIVNSGTVLAMVRFDGSTSSMSTSASSGTPNIMTAYIKAVIQGTGGGAILEHSSNYNSNQAALLAYDSRAAYVAVHGSAGYSQAYFLCTPCGNVFAMQADRTQLTNALMSGGFSGGRALTATSNPVSGTLPTGAFGSHPWFLGARNNSTAYVQMDFETAAIYELSSAHSAAVANRISRQIG